MASPLDALGAAAAILQLVDYGVHLSKKAVEIYKSNQKLTAEANELEEMSSKFKNMNKKLIYKYNQTSVVLADGEKDIMTTAQACDSAAVELLQTLDSLRPTGSKNFAKSVVAAVRSERRQAEIETSVKKLTSLRQLLNDQILRLVSDQTSSIAQTLQQLEQRTSGLASDLGSYKQELLDAINTKDHARIPECLEQMHKEGEAVLFRRDMLASLKYEEIRWRWGRIKEPGKATYEWVFDESQGEGPSIRFICWLDQENGIFWITGKAGSGKSTLMKHICTHPQTKTSLERWANGRRLLIGTHFFWYLGTNMQRSYEGLMQSMLYEVLRKCPEAADILCATRRGDDAATRAVRTDAWISDELRQSVLLLADEAVCEKLGICLCFFIDGLDEYDGEHDEVVELLKLISRSKHIKICVSSRPWEVFQDSFAESVRLENSLILQQHTKADILKFIEQEIGEQLTKRSINRGNADALKHEIVEKAQGVFLWVALVIKKELKPGLRYADDIEKLRDRLRHVPSELGDYFQRIFDAIDPVYAGETARIFLTCMQASEPLPIHTVRLIINDHPRETAQDARVDNTFRWVDKRLFEEARKQVNGRCQDLLEVEPPDLDSFDRSDGATEDRIHRIQFLHRSVQDYLGQKGMWQMLHDRAGKDFNAQATLLAAYVFLIKKAPSLNATNRSGISMQWSTLALHHAADIDHGPTSRALLQQLDSAMTAMQAKQGSVHWTNYLPRTSVSRQAQTLSDDALLEHGHRDFLGHLIELGLTSHASAMLNAQPTLISKKRGRPYLDYALRFSMPTRDLVKPSISPHVELVELLLQQGSRADEKVWIYDGRTVWNLYVSYLYEIGVHTEESRQVAWRLIQHGALDFQCEIITFVDSGETAKYRNRVFTGNKKIMPMKDLLQAVFGDEEACVMCEAVARNGSSGWASFFKGWR